MRIANLEIPIITLVRRDPIKPMEVFVFLPDLRQRRTSIAGRVPGDLLPILANICEIFFGAKEEAVLFPGPIAAFFPSARRIVAARFKNAVVFPITYLDGKPTHSIMPGIESHCDLVRYTGPAFFDSFSRGPLIFGAHSSKRRDLAQLGYTAGLLAFPLRRCVSAPTDNKSNSQSGSPPANHGIPHVDHDDVPPLRRASPYGLEVGKQDPIATRVGFLSG